MRFGKCPSIMSALLLATAGCDQPIAAPAPADAKPAQDIQAPGGEVGFNPQPEPPATIVGRFEMVGPTDGSLRGEYERNGAPGSADGLNAVLV